MRYHSNWFCSNCKKDLDLSTYKSRRSVRRLKAFHRRSDCKGSVYMEKMITEITRAKEGWMNVLGSINIGISQRTGILVRTE